MIRFHPATRNPIGRLLLLLALCLTVPVAAAAQSGSTGGLTGAAHDPNGAAVPGAIITARNLGTGLQQAHALRHPDRNDGQRRLPPRARRRRHGRAHAQVRLI
jgi:hypothetical protein